MTYHFVVIEGKVKGQIFGSYRGQTGKNDSILLSMVSKYASSKYNERSEKFAICEMLRYYGYTAKMVSQWTLTFSPHNHVTETCYT